MRIKRLLMGGVAGLGVVVAVTSCAVLVASAWLDRTYSEDLCFVRTSRSCLATVHAEPDISTAVYSLGLHMRFLVVLTSQQKSYPEIYYVDASAQKIGVADCGTYRPFWKGALVSWLAIEGYPDDGAVVADWTWINENRDLRIRVRGLAEANGSPVLDSSYFESPAAVRPSIKPPTMVELGYGREIVLKGQGGTGPALKIQNRE